VTSFGFHPTVRRGRTPSGALFNGDFGSAALGGAIIAAVAVAALGLIVGTRAMQRST
jgi:hypothetical protein